MMTKKELINTRKDWIILKTTSLILAEIPLITSLVFLATWTSYGWYKVFLYTLVLKSEPLRTDNLVVSHRTKILKIPAIIEAEIAANLRWKWTSFKSI